MAPFCCLEDFKSGFMGRSKPRQYLYSDLMTMGEVCAVCNDPLVVTIEPWNDENGDTATNSISLDGKQTLPDDVHLQACGHHLHWQCLLDAFSLTACPSCSSDLVTPHPSGQPDLKGQVLCNLTNEGGHQVNLDILPQLEEEGYLKAYPEERKARAFLDFCGKGDLEAMLGVLGDTEEEDGSEDLLAFDVVRYQDQLYDMKSTLHAAVASGNEQVVWVLLYLASDLPREQFPSELLQEAEAMGLPRTNGIGNVDIRSLKDKSGRTAQDLAREIGGPWTSWVGTGRLAA